jgi:hypothetical protein
MAHLIQAPTLSEAWCDALAATLGDGGRSVNLAVSWPGVAEEPGIRRAVDEFLAQRRKEFLANKGKRRQWAVWTVETVANTIFPIDLYVPEKGDAAIGNFTELYLEGREFARSVSPEGEYCERLVAWPGATGPVNQLEVVAKKLRRIRNANRAGRGALSSDYELAVVQPADDFDLRVQAPGFNNSPYGFPCLSHISVTIHDGQLHLSALYRNQHLVRKGYGNYLGLARLGSALAHEAGLPQGEVLVIATHADAEVGSAKGFGKTVLQALASRGAYDRAG